MKSDNRPLGRPRLFSIDRALDDAIELFEFSGFDGTSVRDLANNLGISQSSLYCALGHKEQIFSKALDRFETRVGFLDMRALSDAPSLEEGVSRLSLVLISRTTRRGKAPGCLILSGGIASIPANEAVVKDLRSRRSRHVRAISLALRAKMSSANAETTGRYIAAALTGLAVQARDGVGRAQMKSTVPFIATGSLIKAD